MGLAFETTNIINRRKKKINTSYKLYSRPEVTTISLRNTEKGR